MKNVVLVFTFICTAFVINAQSKISASVGLNSGLERHLGKYPDRTGTGVFGAMLGNFIIGVISEGEYWGNIESNENWVTKKYVDSRSQFNVAYEMPIDKDKKMYMGLIYTNANYKFTKEWDHGPKTSTYEKFSGLMLTAQYSWFRNSWLDLSSGLGVGIAKQTVTGYIKETRHPLLGQVTPVKATFSQENIGVFVAPGFGSAGTQVGAVVKF